MTGLREFRPIQRKIERLIGDDEDYTAYVTTLFNVYKKHGKVFLDDLVDSIDYYTTEITNGLSRENAGLRFRREIGMTISIDYTVQEETKAAPAQPQPTKAASVQPTKAASVQPTKAPHNSGILVHQKPTKTIDESKEWRETTDSDIGDDLDLIRSNEEPSASTPAEESEPIPPPKRISLNTKMNLSTGVSSNIKPSGPLSTEALRAASKRVVDL
jgi:hypothetical protein